jgi:hypothetical protein
VSLLHKSKGVAKLTYFATPLFFETFAGKVYFPVPDPDALLAPLLTVT